MNESSKLITAACGQMRPIFGETEANLSHITQMTERAEADLMVFPELATSGYEFRDRGELKSLAFSAAGYGDEATKLKQLAGDTKTYIVIGFPELSDGDVYNSAALIQPAGSVHTYRKIHLFDRELKLFNKGEAPPPVINTPLGRIGLMICFDWIFPETARLLGIGAAQVVCHPSNLVLAYCQKAMFARSVENGVFSITCNRIGSETRTDRTLTFTGQSQILSNRGAVLAQATADEEAVISAQFDPTEADSKMITDLNHIITDRRVELYSQLIM